MLDALLHSPERAIAVRPAYRWYVLGTVLIGAFMSALDASILNIALPTINEAYRAPMVVVEWVSLSYLLTLTLLLPFMGRLADIFGRKPLYNLGFVLFTIGSWLCGSAGGIHELIAWRVLQAVGAALLQSNSLALITQVFPERERGRAIGIQGSVQAAAMSFGPFLGGFLIQHWSCHTIFFINLPIGVAGTFVAWMTLPSPESRKRDSSVDYAGGIVFSAALSILMLVLTHMAVNDWISHHETALMFACLVAGTAFVLVEARARSPFIQLSLFAERNFTIGNLAGMLSYVALFAPMFLMPFYMERVLHYDVQQAGLLLTPIPVALAVTAPLSGYLADKVGIRIFTVGGMLLTSVSLFSFTFLHSNSTSSDITWRLALLGVAMGLFTPPNNKSVMGAAPEKHLSVAGGLLNMMRSLGMMGGVAFAETIYRRHLHGLLARLPAEAQQAVTQAKLHAMMRSFDLAYKWMALVALAAAVLSFVKKREEQTGRRGNVPPLEF
jgi:EmrB/QacA subfamily drug resistance transporter